jgi:hypothetical protein
MKSKELKYIIVAESDNHEYATLFDKTLVHSLMAPSMYRVVSAGFCQMRFDDRSENALIVDAYGGSTSLKLKSRECDKDIIYKSMIVGLWDYYIEPDDPGAPRLQKMIDKANSKDD